MNGWDACTMEPNYLLRWIECHPSLAGYVQAVGVVITIAIAIFGPPLGSWIARIRARIERRRRTIELARALVPSINTLIERVDARLSTLGIYDEPDEGGRNVFFEKIMIEIPGALDLILLSDTDFDIDRVAFIKRLNEQARGYNVSIMNRRLPDAQKEQWAVLREETLGALRKLKEMALNALRTIQEM